MMRSVFSFPYISIFVLFIFFLGFCVQTRVLRPKPILSYPPTLVAAERPEWTLYAIKDLNVIPVEVNESTVETTPGLYSNLLIGGEQNPDRYVVPIDSERHKSVLLTMGIIPEYGRILLIGTIDDIRQKQSASHTVEVDTKGVRKLLCVALSMRPSDYGITLGILKEKPYRARFFLLVYEAESLISRSKGEFYWSIDREKDRRG